MRLKFRVKSLEGRMVRERPAVFRSAEDVLADMRVAGMPREVALSRMILRLAPYAGDPQVADELRNSCRDQILAIADCMNRLADSRPQSTGDWRAQCM